MPSRQHTSASATDRTVIEHHRHVRAGPERRNTGFGRRVFAAPAAPSVPGRSERTRRPAGHPGCWETSRAGSGLRRRCCWRSRPCCICGTSKPRDTPTPSMPRPSRRARKDWTALLFGSLDAGNAITVDKPPAALWIPALVGTGLWFFAAEHAGAAGTHGGGRRRTPVPDGEAHLRPAAGLLAGGVLALTPVAALMFRFNNPDAMLTLCLVLAAYLTTRAIEKAGWKWLAAAGAVIGLAFLTKMLQGFLIVPGLALAYLWAAPTSLGRRFLHLLAAAGGIVLVAGSYIALFQLTPVSARPYMAGSETNSFLELTFGYNGLGRITGSEGGGGGVGGARGWHGRECRLRRGRGDHPDVRDQLRRRGVLAASLGPDPAGGRPVVHPPRGPHLLYPGGPGAVGRLAAGHRGDPELHGRHRPPLLRCCAGPGDRRTGGHRSSGTVAGPGLLAGADYAGRARSWPAPSGQRCCWDAMPRGCPGSGWPSWSSACWPRRRCCSGSISHQAVPGPVPAGGIGDCRGGFAAGRRAGQHGVDLRHRSPAPLRIYSDVGPHSVRDGRTGRAVRTGGQGGAALAGADRALPVGSGRRFGARPPTAPARRTPNSPRC